MITGHEAAEPCAYTWFGIKGVTACRVGRYTSPILPLVERRDGDPAGHPRCNVAQDALDKVTAGKLCLTCS